MLYSLACVLQSQYDLEKASASAVPAAIATLRVILGDIGATFRTLAIRDADGLLNALVPFWRTGAGRVRVVVDRRADAAAKPRCGPGVGGAGRRCGSTTDCTDRTS